MTMFAEAAIAERLAALRLTPLSTAAGPDFQIEPWIARMLAQRGWTQADTLPVLYRLSRKIEVARRLCRAYSADLARPVDAAPLAPAALEGLCALFLAWSAFHGDPRFLNTVLKVEAGILAAPAVTLPAVLTDWAMTLLEAFPIAA